MSTRTKGLAYSAAAMHDGDIVTVYPADYEPDDSIKYNNAASFSGDYHYSGK
ncbi:Phage tail fiber [Serratia rubidaea]|nr:Phage tail fiber [Serratia rubidaea]